MCGGFHLPVSQESQTYFPETFKSCRLFAEASSSKHYGTSDSAAANGQQEDESSAGQSDAKDDETSRVGAARAAAFILISCRPSTSESPTASPGRAKRAKKLGT